MLSLSRSRVVLLLVALLCASGALAVWHQRSARADEATIAYSALRTNWDSAEPGLARSSVVASDFGKLFDTTLTRPNGQTPGSFPNQVYAQPLVVKGKLIVATEENQVAALNPVTGAKIWNDNLGGSWTPNPVCGDISPHVGITSTPVYDPSTSTVYLVSRTFDAKWKIHGLDPGTGAEKSGWPQTVGGSPSNGGVAFNSATAGQRAGLLLMGGSLYIGFASYCDHQPYVGYVAAVNTSTHRLTLWATETNTSTARAGVWQSGGGLMSDGAGRIFVSTGNGVSPSPSSGSPVPGTLAESIVRLGVNADGTLTAKNFFSPKNNAYLDSRDLDVGSVGPVGLPASFGGAVGHHPNLLVAGGKEGVLYLLDRDNLGGMAAGGAGGTNRSVDELNLGAGMWARAAAFDGGPNKHYIYMAPSGRSLRAIRVTPNGSGDPTMSITALTSSTFGFSSGSPVVTSGPTTNGSADPSSALVWIVKVDGASGGNATLQAYPADPPTTGSWSPVFQASLGTAAKFIQPATDGNRVYVGTRDGRVLGFGRPVTSAITAPPTEFGLQSVGTASSPPKTVVLTAARATQINSISTTSPLTVNPFTVNTAGIAFPHVMAAGATLSVPVTFKPTVPGSASGLLQVMTGTGTPVENDFSLHGTGVQEGLSASPASLNFGAVSTRTGTGSSQGVTIQNTGSNPATITSIGSPAAPFAVTGLPALGSVIQAQQSVTVSVAFNPTSAGSYSNTFEIGSSTGSVSVPLAGSGVDGAPQMTLNPKLVDFGQVQPGATKSLSFTLTNTGTTVLTITKAGVPAAPFFVATPISEGQQLAPGQVLTITVKASPTSAEPVTGSYDITSDDNTIPPQQQVVLKVNKDPWTGPVPSPLGCIDINGAAAAGTPAVSSPCNAASATQNFSLSPGQPPLQTPVNQNVHLGAANSTLCLSPQGGATALGTAVQLATCSAAASQQWQWRTDNSLVNTAASLCLDVTNASTAANTPLRLNTCSAASNAQYWNFSAQQAARGAVSSGVGATGQICIDDRGGLTANGNAIQSYPCNLTASQIITHVGNTLRVLGQCIGVQHSGTLNGSLITLYRCNATTPQQWLAKPDGSLFNVNSSKCLDIPGGVTTPGVQLQIYTCNTTPAQRWALPG